MTDPVTATVGVITSLSAAIDILKGVSALRSQTEIDAATMQLNKFILDQNDRLLTYSAKLMEMQDNALQQHEEIARLKKELENRFSYELVDIGNGFKAYVVKEALCEVKDDVTRKRLTYFCQRCYDVDGKAIALQPEYTPSWGIVSDTTFSCHACSSKIRYRHNER